MVEAHSDTADCQIPANPARALGSPIPGRSTITGKRAVPNVHAAEDADELLALSAGDQNPRRHGDAAAHEECAAQQPEHEHCYHGPLRRPVPANGRVSLRFRCPGNVLLW